MAKAKDIKKTGSGELVPISQPGYYPPSKSLLETESTRRVIDLSDDQHNKDDHDKKTENATKRKCPEADSAKTKVSKNARDLAKVEINGLYGEMIEHGRMTIQKAIAIGEKLAEIKETLRHGQFGKWIDTALNFDQKTAERYMKLYNGREKLKIDNLSNIASALRLLDEEKRAKNPKAVKASKQNYPVQVNAPVVRSKPQIVHIDKPQVVEDPLAEKLAAGEVQVIAPAFDVVNAPELLVFVASVPEDILADLMEVTKKHGGTFQYQVIRADGEIKLNDHFSKRLGLMVD